MCKVLYIGQYSEGTTSRMRANILSEILDADFQIIDIHKPFFQASNFERSFGFRYKMGPLINRINEFIISRLKSKYDLIWIDKGMLISKKTISLLRCNTVKLLHFTPDMAFYQNNSRHFNSTIPLYDFIVTTKSAEKKIYEKFIAPEKILFTTQGFDKTIHRPYTTFEKKEDGVVFIGLAEKSRIDIVEYLINNGINLKLAGMGWRSFVKKNQSNKHLKFIGESIYSEDYSKLISSSKLALGLLSKRFPELHTTRTFEIPACGTALLTERNQETSQFFKEDEAIFYSNEKDLLEKVEFYLRQKELLQEITIKGHNRVLKDGYDYESILRSILNQIF